MLQTQTPVQIKKQSRSRMSKPTSVLSRVRSAQWSKATELLFRSLSNSRSAFPDDALALTYVDRVEEITRQMSARHLQMLEQWLKSSDLHMTLGVDYLDQLYRFSYEGGLVPVSRDLVDPNVRPALNILLHLKVQL